MSHAPRLRDVLVSLGLWKALETVIPVPKLTGGFCFYITGPIKELRESDFTEKLMVEQVVETCLSDRQRRK